MDIAALQAFLSVADSGSFTRAAEHMFVTQPAISKRIAALEQGLGMPLFDRIGRRIQLTEAGRALLPRARSIVGEVKDLDKTLVNLAGNVVGPLTMATSHHIGLHRLPPALALFHEQFPKLSLDLRFMDSESACQVVAIGELELALVTLPTKQLHPLRFNIVWDDPLEIVVAKNHPLAHGGRVSKETLIKFPAILPGPGTFTRKLVLSALTGYQDKLTIAMATNYLEVLKMLATIGLGWTALPHTMIDDDLIVVQAEGMAIHRQLGIVTHSARTLSNAAQKMIQVVKGTA